MKNNETSSYFMEELVGPVQKEEEFPFSQVFPFKMIVITNRLCEKGCWRPDETV